MKTNTGSSSRIREALRTIRGIAQEIVDAAADPSRKLSDLFTEAAIQRKVDACMGLALAVAACGRCKWLREVRREVEETAAVVVAADNALAPRITLNPEMMNHVIGAEQKVFDLLLAASLKVLVLAKLARMMRPQLATYLHKESVGIRIELLHWERERNAERVPLCGGSRPAYETGNEVRMGKNSVRGLEGERLQPVCLAEIGDGALKKIAAATGGEARRPRQSGRGNGRAQFGASGVGAEGRRGPQTAFMAKQRKSFLEYLKVHPETASISRITRARECWAIRRKEWDAAAKKGIGYADYKGLARSNLI